MAIAEFFGDHGALHVPANTQPNADGIMLLSFGTHDAPVPAVPPPLVEEPVAVLAVLLATLAVLFSLERHAWGAAFFRRVPLLLFAYFVPTILSNLDVIPMKSAAYGYVQDWLLPASLILLTMSIDLPAIFSLGKLVVLPFLGATLAIAISGPLAYLALGWMVPAEYGDQGWRGLAALCGSWIGGSANFVAIGKSVDAAEKTIQFMVPIDVTLYSVWTALLLFFSSREERMDRRVGANRKALEDVKRRITAFHAEVARPTSLPDLLSLLAIAIGITAIAHALAPGLVAFTNDALPGLRGVVKAFTWIVLLATTAALALSFTPIRRLEGAGASALGSTFLYLLVASIGAGADFAGLSQIPVLLMIATVWMAMHALFLLAARRIFKIPIFFIAVGSQANIGGAASAPIIASAFHRSLAPVGALLGVAGYLLGTYVGLVCAFFMELVHRLYS